MHLFYNPCMRIFIGIKLDDTVLDSLEKFLEPFKKIASPVKWTKRENLHITLKFIGDVPDETYSKIESRLANTDFNTGPVTLKFQGCGKFGKGRDMNIFWVGMEKDDTLEEMFNRLEYALEKTGIPKESRKFKPHITVARNKKSFNFNAFFQLIDDNRDRLISEFAITRFQVYKSDLTPEGPIYTVLKEIPLVTT